MRLPKKKVGNCVVRITKVKEKAKMGVVRVGWKLVREVVE